MKDERKNNKGRQVPLVFDSSSLSESDISSRLLELIAELWLAFFLISVCSPPSAGHPYSTKLSSININKNSIFVLGNKNKSSLVSL